MANNTRNEVVAHRTGMAVGGAVGAVAGGPWGALAGAWVGGIAVEGTLTAKRNVQAIRNHRNDTAAVTTEPTTPREGDLVQTPDGRTFVVEEVTDVESAA